jgi:hypothetical protein
MNQQKYQVGDTLEMSCSACDADTVHSVEAATKLGKISKASCTKCQTTSTFTRGVKTGVSMSGGSTASPYDRTRKYRKGQSMLHATFGQGEVTAVVDPQKIDVLFGDRTRRLIHAQE